MKRSVYIILCAVYDCECSIDQPIRPRPLHILIYFYFFPHIFILRTGSDFLLSNIGDTVTKTKTRQKENNKNNNNKK